MASRRARTTFVCVDCGAESMKWMGRCPTCQAWNTLEERNEKVGPAPASPHTLSKLVSEDEERKPIEVPEFDRVMGGGLVTGSLVLLGGDPGVGKSTLLLQVAEAYAKRWGEALYVSAEESARQLRLRASRLGVASTQLSVLNETDLGTILAYVEAARPGLVVIDSVQAISMTGIDSVPGSVAQTRACTYALMQVAKTHGITIVLVGHVNKQGALAGPKVLEHAVDVVLSFEGERHTAYRMLRAVKNRYGSTNELGVFSMNERGLEEVANPSALFLAERPEGAPGSVVVACMEGSRPLLVEIQALVGPAPYGGTPRRQTAGVDRNRAAIVLAVLEKRAGVQLQAHDVYISVAGGLAVDEPAADLGIALAVASSFKGRHVEPHTVVFGEIGLVGELRRVSHAERRLNEARKLGFRRCILPSGVSVRQPDGIDLVPVARLTQALQTVLE
ncbi:MAG: DNA repair protein RadA [Limnochordia bacterium]|jgi:DNA repair protein RadA/Sms